MINGPANIHDPVPASDFSCIVPAALSLEIAIRLSAPDAHQTNRAGQQAKRR
jgi:hypothetical protein